MSKVNALGSRVAMVVGHMAGMIDMAALPIWVGVLIAGYSLAPAQAGALPTLFLFGVVIASLVLSQLFHRLPGRWMPALGFGLSAAIFYLMSTTQFYGLLMAGHLAAGVCTGVALSFTHGTMGRTSNPHRIFAMGNLMLGVFAVFFFGAAPRLIADFGPPTIFRIFAAVMTFGAVVTVALFPASSVSEDVRLSAARLTGPVWLVIAATTLMALVQAMTFSFLERMGADRGLPQDQIQTVLIALGLVAITPAIFAALLEKRLPAIGVACGGALLQGLVAILISWSTSLVPYAGGAIAFPFIMIFTHTFVFGHLARLDPTGRAVAATPAVLMSGSMIGPLLGGILVQNVGYQALGAAALAFDLVAIGLFAASRSQKAALVAAQLN
jgi:predicted MFS family arabinose efflux permease